jgi:hypothetical protein
MFPTLPGAKVTASLRRIAPGTVSHEYASTSKPQIKYSCQRAICTTMVRSWGLTNCTAIDLPHVTTEAERIRPFESTLGYSRGFSCISTPRN